MVDSDLTARTTCPHCSFTPKAEQLSFAPAASTLSSLDERLDTLVESWTDRLRQELDDPIASQGLQLVGDKARAGIEAFAKGGELPDPLDADFVSGIRDALSDLAKVEITSAELRSALVTGGSPVTLDDIRKRFEKLLADNLKGKDEAKVRFVVIEGAN